MLREAKEKDVFRDARNRSIPENGFRDSGHFRGLRSAIIAVCYCRRRFHSLRDNRYVYATFAVG